MHFRTIRPRSGPKSLLNPRIELLDWVFFASGRKFLTALQYRTGQDRTGQDRTGCFSLQIDLSLICPTFKQIFVLQITLYCGH